ncbi:response regulator [Anaerosacchariphilus polymeriproducens]|uniref:Stage 0 sporulation protein A homolog n=1 Tax=Anaerosacchariphilus polymeriproducens TaxID=1812858 RepID=A0A371AVE3_9FIRM|nr:response regulator transcription factor [Anaerosacchariphilus polymeriproducens]RDU23555.1 DNA-binding response regulator [Anaerosacchariphilus polymeriproducens]
MKIKVMIADDHKMVREGIKQLLELEGDIKVVTEVSNGIECLEKLKEFIPDVLLLDINMPSMNGLEVLKELNRKKFEVKVLLLTIHNEVEYLIKALDLGVYGYVLKDSGSNILKKAIYSVYNSSKYFEPSITPLLNSKLVQRDIDKIKLELLSDREIEVLTLLAQGLLNKQIAIKLDVSERTIKNHIFSIFKKISVTDRTQAAIFAIRNDLYKVI